MLVLSGRTRIALVGMHGCRFRQTRGLVERRIMIRCFGTHLRMQLKSQNKLPYRRDPCRGNDAMMAENPMMETCSAMANNENRGIRCVAIAG
jgi:hypothetical protein